MVVSAFLHHAWQLFKSSLYRLLFYDDSLVFTQIQLISVYVCLLVDTVILSFYSGRETSLHFQGF